MYHDGNVDIYFCFFFFIFGARHKQKSNFFRCQCHNYLVSMVGNKEGCISSCSNNATGCILAQWGVWVSLNKWDKIIQLVNSLMSILLPNPSKIQVRGRAWESSRLHMSRRKFIDLFFPFFTAHSFFLFFINAISRAA